MDREGLLSCKDNEEKGREFDVILILAFPAAVRDKRKRQTERERGWMWMMFT